MSHAHVPQEMPAWFSGISDYVTRLLPQQQELTKQQQENVIKLMQVVDMDGARIAKLEKVLLKLEEWKRVCLSVLRAEIAQSAPPNDQLIDDCEVRVSNIPVACKSEPFEIATSVLHSIGCGHLCSQIVDARSWSVLDNKLLTRSIVFQLNSPLSRDKAMRHASRLSNLTASDVLGIASSTRLYMNRLLPKPLYVLYRQACDRARALGYMRPIVRGLKIFMRISHDSPLIPILQESDLPVFETNLSKSETVETSTSKTEATINVESIVSNVSEFQTDKSPSVTNSTTSVNVNNSSTLKQRKKDNRKDRKKLKSRIHVKR